MIVFANSKHHSKALSFFHATAPSFAANLNKHFDDIICVDVIEHMTDVPAEVRAMASMLADDGEIVILMANPLWEPILLLLEKFKLKMPEGPHYRMPYRKLNYIMASSGLCVAKHDWYLAFPMHVPVFSAVINAVVHAIPIVRRIGLVEMIVARHKP
jgi:SAM-dependent methyltransferase